MWLWSCVPGIISVPSSVSRRTLSRCCFAKSMILITLKLPNPDEMTAHIPLTTHDRADQPPHHLARRALSRLVQEFLRAAGMRSIAHRVRAVARSAGTPATLALKVSGSADGQRRTEVDIVPVLGLERNPTDTLRRR